MPTKKAAAKPKVKPKAKPKPEPKEVHPLSRNPLDLGTWTRTAKTKDV